MSKKTQVTQDEGEIAKLRDENAAMRAQNDQMLDALAEMQDQIAKLQQAQTGKSAQISKAQQVTEELDAEWADLREEFKDLPNIDVLERGVLEGAEASDDIRLLDEPPVHADPHGVQRKWRCKWFNHGKEGQAYKATALGYIKVLRAELRDAESLAASGPQSDQFVRRGDRGLEVLYKIPMKIYVHRQKRQAAKRAGQLQSASYVKDMVANRVANMAGESGQNADQAGSFVHGGMSVSVEPGETERVTI
jgi:uncharacterized protein YukE